MSRKMQRLKNEPPARAHIFKPQICVDLACSFVQQTGKIDSGFL